MSGILNSGKLQTLLTRLTAARAAYLDAAISSRASATDYTSARAAKLDNLDVAVSSVGGMPVPGTLHVPTSHQNIDVVTTAEAATFGVNASTVSSGSTQSTYSDLLNVTGAGVISFLGISCENGGTGTDAMQARLSIDGSVVWTSASEALGTGGEGWIPIGAMYDTGASGPYIFALDSIRFKTSFQLEIRNNSSTTTYDFLTMSKYFTE